MAISTRRRAIGGICRALLLLTLLALITPVGLFAGVRRAAAFDFTVTVNTTADSNNPCATTGTGTCSLRDAVRYANLAASADPGYAILINLPLGSFTLTQAGAGEDNATTGDLDIRARVTIEGAGYPRPTIDGNAADRVFQVFSSYSLALRGVAVRNGRLPSNQNGAGINAAGALTLYNSSVENSVAPGGASFGGGIAATGVLEISHSLITGNSASYGGGINAGGTLAATNVLIAENTATSGFGGGLYSSANPATLTFVTIASNIGGGLVRFGGTLTLINTLVANNADGDNCFGTVANGGYNLDSGATCGFGAANNSLSNANAGFDTPSLGGRLRYNSDARDRIPSTDPTCRGGDYLFATRPFGGRCDIGAVEGYWFTVVSVAAASGPSGGTATLTATLTDQLDNLPIAGRTVDFTINGVAAGSATTNASGVATLSASLAGVAPGSYPTGVGASFTCIDPLDNLLSSSPATAALTVTEAPSPPPTPTPSPTPTSSPSPSPAPSGPPPSFIDVPPDYWAHDQIIQFAQRGITTGCGPGEYCPERPVTRAEMAAFIIRTVTGQTAAPAGPATPTFADVPPTHPQYGYIEALVARGITTGCGPGEYCPDRPVSRAEMAAFIIRALTGSTAAPAAPATPTFGDVPPTQAQYGFVEEMFRRGVTTGCGDPNASPRSYCPDSNVTRAEMAVFIIRAYPAP